MSKENVLCGLDIGSTKIRTIIVKKEYDSSQYLVVGVGESLSYGIRKGTMVDFEETVSSISESLEKAERMSGVQINHAVVSIGGTHISSQNSKGVIAVSRADGEVSSQDVERVIEAARAVSLPVNREILHIIPKNFIVDGQQGIKDPIGMNGMRLEVDAHIIEGGTHFIKNISRCTEQAGIEVDALVLSPLAAAKAILDKRQKELGVALVDIGGGTCGLAVFEEGDLIHSQILPVGAEHITNDLAIG
ncbi:cell division protein FtsA, partial [bacterium (Candidatus Torokbacteria) CG_4_10_14_0_2_um_filter_35_8]